MHSTQPAGVGKSLHLNNGVSIPQLGLGVFRAGPGKGTYDAVYAALEAGVRHIDTARIYANEREVGTAVRDWCADRRASRSSVFVTTKLWNEDQGYARALRAISKSAEQLDLGAIDLYLMHWPVPQLRKESWRAMERALKDGLVRAIGISNFETRHIEELLRTAEVVPAVNQIELHPFLQQRGTVECCKRHGILVQAYSPLTKGRMLDHPVLLEQAQRQRCTAAQLLIAWSLHCGFVSLPKSSNVARIQENTAAAQITLTETAMAALNGLDGNLRTAWDPSSVP